MHALTLRLADSQAATLAAVARVEGTSVSEIIRRAIDEAIEQRRADPVFAEHLRRLVAEDRAILERLGAG